MKSRQRRYNKANLERLFILDLFFKYACATDKQCQAGTGVAVEISTSIFLEKDNYFYNCINPNTVTLI